jgi:hypothetical protein
MVRPGRIVALIAFFVALISGFLAWFVMSTASYSLIDGYQFVIKLVSGGISTSAFNSGFGSMMPTSSSNFTLLLLIVAITLIFWPACVVSGLIELVGRSVRPHPAIYGIIALISGYIFLTTAKATIGIGFWLEVVAVIIFFVAYFVDGATRRARTLPQGAYTCTQCGARFDTSQALATHIAAAHPSTGTIPPTSPS